MLFRKKVVNNLKIPPPGFHLYHPRQLPGITRAACVNRQLIIITRFLIPISEGIFRFFGNVRGRAHNLPKFHRNRMIALEKCKLYYYIKFVGWNHYMAYHLRNHVFTMPIPIFNKISQTVLNYKIIQRSKKSMT